MHPENAATAGGSIQDARRDLYRQHVLAAAELEFSRAGFTETKMSAIARTAGLSLATVYKHFAGKGEIWDDLHAERMTQLLAEVESAALDAQTAIDRLVSGVSAVAQFLTSHDAYLEMSIRAGAGWASSAETAVGVQRTVWSAGIEMIESGIETALATGEVRAFRPRVAAGLVVSSLQVWMIDWVDSGRDRPASVVIDELTTHLRRMLES
jgi:AcrR family transcriptional regulator